MSIFFEILVRIASYGPQIDQPYGENRLSHIINENMFLGTPKSFRKGNYPLYMVVHIKQVSIERGCIN